MKSSVLKQYMELDGFPLIFYALRAFEESRADEIILVTGKEQTEYCRREIVDKYHFHKVKAVVCGGSERYLSVYEGLRAIRHTDIVIIHDGARPFVTNDIIERAIQAAGQFGSGVAAMPVKDTIKIADADGFAVKTPVRDSVYTIQTPQAFDYVQILQAYEQVVSRQTENITDDAMVLELALHKPVKLVEGCYRNIKVTTEEDMEIAAVFAEKIRKNPGYDK